MDKKANLYTNTANVTTDQIGSVVDNVTTVAENQRRGFARRWYDNNFFDDGFHFRFLSRQTNKIVDLSEKQTVYAPTRVVPKASKQIRGIANLLTQDSPSPAVYPENISRSDYKSDEEYQQAVQSSKLYAQRTGNWLTEEWKKQELMSKLNLMVILALKHGVSYLQVWPDAVDEKIKTQVYDAFDIYLLGNLTSIYDSPFICKAVPMLISEIKANENFNEDQKTKINPDNRFASSEIKQAYMMSRYGTMTNSDQTATLILKECYFKEYLNTVNMDRIRAQEDGDKLLKDRKVGDPIIRQVFSAGGVWLKDTYLDLPDYPFVDFRMEPGPIYQVPQIERFISSNKSLDQVVSRIERYTHTMAAGVWLKKQGEQWNVNNQAGGQVIEYSSTPPTQGQIAPLPQFLFEFINLLNGFIEEQGVSPLMLGHLPSGVRSANAIESLREVEITNLKLGTSQLNRTVKKISEKMLDIADSYFVTPQTVLFMDKGQPNYFDIIGGSAAKARKDLKIGVGESVVPIKRDYRVEVEVESGLGFTKVGQKQTIQNMATFFLQMVQAQVISPQVMKYIVEKMLDIYQYGPTQEIMENLKTEDAGSQVNDQTMQKMQIALLQALKDAGEVGPEAQQQRLMENKVGVLQALKESGLIDKMSGPTSSEKPLSESLNISYKDLPEDVKRDVEVKLGLKPSEGVSPVGSDQIIKHQQAENEATQMEQAAEAQMNPQQAEGGQDAVNEEQ